jgi:diguanylate cyclase (GGDEF)-like protein
MIKENQPLRIVMVEPEQEDRARYRRMLEQSARWSYAVVEVESLAAATEYCAKKSPDCLLMGPHIPVAECKAWLDFWRPDAGDGSLPCVLLTAVEDAGAAALDRSGRVAYLPVEYASSDAVCHSIQRAIERIEMLVQICELRAGALYDDLTHLLSCNAVVLQLSKDLARAQRTGKVLGVGLCEIDHYAELVQEQGEEAGKRVVAELARYIGGAIRSTDTCGRYSEHQFLLILPGFDYSCATFERIRRATMGALISVGDQKISIATSVAAVFCRGNEPKELVLEEAEMALKNARAQGRTGVILASHPGMPR